MINLIPGYIQGCCQVGAGTYLILGSTNSFQRSDSLKWDVKKIRSHPSNRWKEKPSCRKHKYQRPEGKAIETAEVPIGGAQAAEEAGARLQTVKGFVTELGLYSRQWKSSAHMQGRGKMGVVP